VAALLGVALLAVGGATGWELAAFAWWAAGMLVLAFVDLAVSRLPHRLTATTTAGFLAALALTGDGQAWWRAVTAGLMVALFFAVLAVTSRGQLGWGDVALAVPLAAALGWHSWTAVYIGLIAGLAAAATTAVVMRWTARLPAGAHLPLGPFLIAGAVVVMAWP